MQKVFDLHCDTPYLIHQSKSMHISVPQMHKYYCGVIFAHFVLPKIKHPFIEAVKMISSTMDFLRNKPRIKIIKNNYEINDSMSNVILGVEGGHVHDHDFAQMATLYGLGIRVFTITWNNSNQLASSAFDNDKKGLTRKGREFVRLMGNYDAIIDLSHASTRTVLDVCELAKNQVIASHSCVRALNPEFLRNIDDRAIQAIKERGGVIGINVSRKHLGQGSIADHIAYLVDNFSDTVPAIGTDFDGINDPVIRGPAELVGLEQQLGERGYRPDRIEKIFSGNFLRVFKKANKIS